jgi:hypothetical protein
MPHSAATSGPTISDGSLLEFVGNSRTHDIDALASPVLGQRIVPGRFVTVVVVLRTLPKSYCRYSTGPIQFGPNGIHHPVFRYRTPRVIRAFVRRTAGFFEIASVPASVSAGQKGRFDPLSLHRKIPFLTRISETGSMTGWWVAAISWPDAGGPIHMTLTAKSTSLLAIRHSLFASR